MAQTYYVSPTGSDSTSGTEAKPWRTLDQAATTAQAGDTVIFEDGTYDVRSGQAEWNSGREGSPITFKARHRRAAIWALAKNGWTVELEGVEHLTFEGLAIRGLVDDSAARNVSVVNSDHIAFNDCEIYDTRGYGIVMRGNSTYITIQNCEIHQETSEQALDGVGIEGHDTKCHDILVDGCEIYHTPHDGIAVRGGTAIRLTNNKIHDNVSHGISIGDADLEGSPSDVFVEANTIYREGAWGQGGGSTNKHGIRIHGNSKDVTVVRNDVYSNHGPGIGVISSAAGPIDIHNNTLYNNGLGDAEDYGSVFCEWREREPGEPAVAFKRNIVYHTQPIRVYQLQSRIEPGLKFDENLLFDATGREDVRRAGKTYSNFAAYKAAGYEPNSIVSQDPLFADPDAGDFTLQPGSPALAPAIGAHVPGEIEPTPPTPPEPSPPTPGPQLTVRLTVLGENQEVLAEFAGELEVVSGSLTGLI
jgi:hypothetical protein